MGEEMSTGLLEGFFRLEGERSDSQVIDLRRCVHNQENLQFFAEIWDATGLLFAKVASSRKTSNHSEDTSGHFSVDDDRWKRRLAVAVVEIPETMRRCGVGETKANSLVDSIGALRDMHFEVDVRAKQLHNREVSVD